MPRNDAGPYEKALEKLIGEYWTLAYNEGKEGRDHDTENGDAQRVLHEIHECISALANSPARLTSRTLWVTDSPYVCVPFTDDIEQAERWVAAGYMVVDYHAGDQ